MEELLGGKQVPCPSDAVLCFLCPTAAAGTPPAVSLLVCDPVRVLVLCRIVATTYADLEQCAHVIAAACAVKACIDTEVALQSTAMVRADMCVHALDGAPYLRVQCAALPPSSPVWCCCEGRPFALALCRADVCSQVGAACRQVLTRFCR